MSTVKKSVVLSKTFIARVKLADNEQLQKMYDKHCALLTPYAFFSWGTRKVRDFQSKAEYLEQELKSRGINPNPRRK